MKKIMIVCTSAVGAMLISVGSASADGNHLGQVGQDCAATYGFDTLGSAAHTIVQDNGNNAGGLPASLIRYC